MVQLLPLLERLPLVILSEALRCSGRRVGCASGERRGDRVRDLTGPGAVRMPVPGDQVRGVDIDDHVGKVVEESVHDKRFRMRLERPRRSDAWHDEEGQRSSRARRGGGRMKNFPRQGEASLELYFTQVGDFIDEYLPQPER